MCSAEEAAVMVGVLAWSGEGGLSPCARPLAVLLRMARAWEMESRQGGARSSSSWESRQMGSEGDGGRRLAGGATELGVAPAVGVERWTQPISFGLALGAVTIFFFTVFPVR